MKRIFLFFLPVVAILVSGCSTPSDYEQIANGAPIKPIRLTAESTTVFLTDYVPLLAANIRVACVSRGSFFIAS